MAVVYIHTRLDTNEIFYVGIGTNLNRAYTKDRRNKYWKNIVNKVGYKVTILFDNLSREEACLKEIELIKKYGRSDLNEGTLVNMTDGGDGSSNISDEIKKKKSEFMKGNKSMLGMKHSDVTKRKMSDSHKGHVGWNKDTPCSEDVKKKISESTSGFNNHNYGKKHSEDVRKKISEATKGRISQYKGIPRSEETIQKIKDAWQKKKK